MINTIFIQKKYDVEIRKKCKNPRLNLIECLNNSFNDTFVCENYINDFKVCTLNFDKTFRKKFNIKN